MRLSRHRAASLMHPLDHLYLLLLVVGLPLYSAWSWRRWLAKLAAGHRPRRLRLYLGSLAQLWLVFGVLAACWWWLDRSPAPLGFTAPGGTGFWLGAVLVALATGVFAQSWRSMVRADAADRRRYREQLAELGQMMPRNGREYGGFVALSITAGVVEETIFRGWLIWYLQAWMPLTGAVLVSSAAFGLAHLYQGTGGVAKTAVIGLLMALLYLLTGSLWLPIVAHAMIDVLQGATMMELYRRRSGDGGDGGEDGDRDGEGDKGGEPPAATINR